jgi:peroxiredoxin
MPPLAVGAKAPDFELDGSAGKVRLSKLLRDGHYVVLAFFPLAFSSTCTNEMNLFEEVKEEFTRLRTHIIGLSVDSKHVQRAFAQANGLTFPVLADFHPKGAVARKFGVMREDGTTERALFIIDPTGTVRYSYVSEIGKNPGADRLLNALEKMQAEAA